MRIADANPHGIAKHYAHGHADINAYPDSSGYGYTYSASYGYTYRDACRLQHLHHGYWDWHNHAWHHRYRQPLR